MHTSLGSRQSTSSTSGSHVYQTSNLIDARNAWMLLSAALFNIASPILDRSPLRNDSLLQIPDQFSELNRIIPFLTHTFRQRSQALSFLLLLVRQCAQTRLDAGKLRQADGLQLHTRPDHSHSFHQAQDDDEPNQKPPQFLEKAKHPYLPGIKAPQSVP